MSLPEYLVRIHGRRRTPLEGLSNSISFIIETKRDEILENPTTGSQTLTSCTPISAVVFPFINLSSTSHNHIQQLICNTLSNDLYCLREMLATQISTIATDLDFAFNGFVIDVNVVFTITEYNHTVGFVMSDLPSSSPPPMNLNDDKEENSLNVKIFKMVLRGRLNGEELEGLNTETEPCSICLDDLSGSYSKHGKPTRMTCSHVFHGRCLMEWVDRKNTCPMCRTVLYERTTIRE